MRFCECPGHAEPPALITETSASQSRQYPEGSVDNTSGDNATCLPLQLSTSSTSPMTVTLFLEGIPSTVKRDCDLALLCLGREFTATTASQHLYQVVQETLESPEFSNDKREMERLIGQLVILRSCRMTLENEKLAHMDAGRLRQ